MVNSGYPVGDFFEGFTDIFSHLGGCVRHTVAKPDILHFGIIVDCPANRGQGISVFQQPGIGANRFHIAADINNHRDLRQAVGNAGGRTGPAIRQTIFGGDIAGFLFNAAELDGANHVIGAVQGFAAVGGGLDFIIEAVLLYQPFSESGN